MIEITVLNGEFTVNMDTFGNQDPYVLIDVDSGNQQFRSKTKNGAGLYASWRDEHFMVEDGDTMKLRVFDHDYVQDDLIGESDSINLSVVPIGFSV